MRGDRAIDTKKAHNEDRKEQEEMRGCREDEGGREKGEGRGLQRRRDEELRRKGSETERRKKRIEEREWKRGGGL